MRENGYSDAFSFSAYQDFFRPFLAPFEQASERFANADRPIDNAGNSVDVGDGKLPYQTLVHLNMEVWGLAMRRARAYAAIPSGIAHCHTAEDVSAHQADFWRTAIRHYTECAEHSAAIMQTAASGMPGFAPMHEPYAASDDQADVHDYMEVSKPSTDPDDAHEQHLPVKRRAARSRKAA